MTEFQSSEAILNDLFSSIESKYDKIGINSNNETEDEDSDSTKSSEEKVSQVRKIMQIKFCNLSFILIINPVVLYSMFITEWRIKKSSE